MATIRFQGQFGDDSKPGIYDLGGSGLGFFGSTAGSSVQIASYQDSTYVSNADGSTTTDQMHNWKFINSASYPSGSATVGAVGGSAYSDSIAKGLSRDCSFGIEFSHTSAVKVQNTQLRIYDRTNINYPASGVNTKVCEIVNFGGVGQSYADQAASASHSLAGSGDCFWWGEPWPLAQLLSSKNYYTNSVGTAFYNGTDADTTITNGDVRLGQVTGDRATVGGTGIVVPLLDSPGSGQKQLQFSQQANASHATNTGMIWPKFTQYLATTSQTAMFSQTFGDGSGSNIKYTYGGTGVDTHHTWCIGISATPLSIGSKEQYGLYVSLEYL